MWHGRSSIGVVQEGALDAPADRVRPSYAGGIGTPRAMRQRAVGLDDPERDEQAGDGRAVVDAAERVGHAAQRRGLVDRLVRLTGEPTMNRVTR